MFSAIYARKSTEQNGVGDEAGARPAPAPPPRPRSDLAGQLAGAPKGGRGSWGKAEGTSMRKDYRGHKYEITAQREGFQFAIWPPDSDPRSPGLSWGSPRTEQAAERMVKEWIDLYEGPDRIERVSRRIFAALCTKARTQGGDTEMTRVELETAVRESHADFVTALRRLHEGGSIYIRIVAGDPDRIALGTKWQEECDI